MTPSLSIRGHRLLDQGALLDLMVEASEKAAELQEWDAETNPSGMLSVAGAKNALMGDFMEKFSNEQMKGFDLAHHLQYGPDTGSKALKAAMASYFNRYFDPALPVREEDILATNGSTSIIEHLAWTIFDPGDGLLLPTPTYALFPFNFESRAQVKVLRVPMTEVKDQFKGEYAAEVIKQFEETYRKATSKGINVKGLLLCNPNNPLGRCYSKRTLIEIASFCGKYGLHLISDEVYAMSILSHSESAENKDEGPKSFDGFTSALSIANPDIHGDPSNTIHVTYGAAKDFGMGGMRLGFLATRNQTLKDMIGKLGTYSWPTVSSDFFFTKFAGDHESMDEYLRVFKVRLDQSYKWATELLKSHNIKFSPANAGLFLWLDLSEYLSYFKGSDESGVPMNSKSSSRELQLCRYLIGNGIFMAPGEMFESPIPGYFRFTTSLPKRQVEAAVKRLADSLSILRNEAPEQLT